MYVEVCDDPDSAYYLLYTHVAKFAQRHINPRYYKGGRSKYCILKNDTVIEFQLIKDDNYIVFANWNYGPNYDGVDDYKFSKNLMIFEGV